MAAADERTTGLNWIQYWTGDTVDDNLGPDPLNHTADNAFRKKGVEPGDTIFVLSFRNGNLYVVGRLVVAEILDQKPAERKLGQRLWKAKDHVIGEPGRSTPVRDDAIVPPDRIDEIGFLDDSGARSHPKRNHGKLEPQTFRHTRRIDSSTAALFEDVLASHP